MVRLPAATGPLAAGPLDMVEGARPAVVHGPTAGQRTARGRRRRRPWVVRLAAGLVDMVDGAGPLDMVDGAWLAAVRLAVRIVHGSIAG